MNCCIKLWLLQKKLLTHFSIFSKEIKITTRSREVLTEIVLDFLCVRLKNIVFCDAVLTQELLKSKKTKQRGKTFTSVQLNCKD